MKNGKERAVLVTTAHKGVFFGYAKDTDGVQMTGFNLPPGVETYMIPGNEDGMQFAYADPPYLGCCAKYGHRHEAPYGCWNDLETHRQMLRTLRDEYPDGWVLSLGSNNLEDMLHLCRQEIGPNSVRTGSWCKPFARFVPNVNPGYVWEPVIFTKGRKYDRYDPTIRDFVILEDPAHVENITLRKGLPGAKPPKFADWILDLLGVDFAAGDTIDDLFPGTHGMTLAWKERREPTQGAFVE